MEIQFSSELSKLHAHPFSPAARVDRPYLSSSFREALASLYYGLEYGTRVLLLSGESGVGKTTLLHYWERRIQSRGRTLFVSSNADNAFDVLQTLTTEIAGLAPGDMKAAGLQTDDVLRTLTASGKPFILLLDFNEDCAGSALDILNHLTKLEYFKTAGLRVVIAVPDDVAQELLSSEFSHDIHRVALAPMKAAEIEGYIEHRLRIAGWSGGALVSLRGYTSIAERSSGKPSVINEICFKLLQKVSEENDRSDKQDRNQIIPLNEPDIDAVIPGKKSDSGEPSENALDEVASPKSWFNRRTATIASIVLILVMAIVGLWYEIATKANSARRASLSTIPTAAVARHHAVTRESHLTVTANAVPRTTATAVPMSADPVSTVAAQTTGTPRIVSSSTAAVLIKDARYSEGPVDKKNPKLSSALPSSTPSRSAIATLASAPAEMQPPHTAISSGGPAKSEDGSAPAKQTVQEMATHEITLGDTYMKKGEYDKALSSFSKALALAPGDQEAEEKIKRARRAKATEENILQ